MSRSRDFQNGEYSTFARSVLRTVSACSVFALLMGATVGSAPRPHVVLVTASLGAYPLGALYPPAILSTPLHGEPIPRTIAVRRAVAVILDNYSPDARPQSGLNAASVVIETLVEGGITRIMAIYLEHDAPVVGPVRSTRVYFDDWAGAFH